MNRFICSLLLSALALVPGCDGTAIDEETAAVETSANDEREASWFKKCVSEEHDCTAVWINASPMSFYYVLADVIEVRFGACHRQEAAGSNLVRSFKYMTFSKSDLPAQVSQCQADMEDLPRCEIRSGGVYLQDGSLFCTGGNVY